MATNNVNIINITNLPKAQDIVSGNYLIVQNDLGTQIIDWENVYVVKLDSNGNGTMAGGLTAGSFTADNGNFGALSADSIFSGGNEGLTYADDYKNRFIISNGVITSAYYAIGSPEYEDLITNIIPAATASITNLTQAVYESYATVDSDLGIGSTYTTLTFDTMPSTLQDSSFTPADFMATYVGTASLSAFLYVNDFTTGPSNTLKANLYIRQVATEILDKTDFHVKVSKHYTV